MQPQLGHQKNAESRRPFMRIISKHKTLGSYLNSARRFLCHHTIAGSVRSARRALTQQRSNPVVIHN